MTGRLFETDEFLPIGWPSDSDWTQRLQHHFDTDGFRQLMAFVERDRDEHTVYPPVENVFQTFMLTPFSQTSVVILGQDPYHGPEQAHGLSFSVRDGIKIPPSLKNIYKEMATDLNCSIPTTGNLTPWAQQGVLLLNTVLTVRDGQANSHRKKGWESFTDEVIRQLNDHPQPIVFILWGKPAEKKLALISDRHPTIVSAHPSPLSARRGFFESRPFSKANEFLSRAGRPTIAWSFD